MKRYTIPEIEHCHIIGRTTKEREPLTLFWSGAGIELCTTASELSVELTADYDFYEPWIEVILDGVLSQRRMLDRGQQTVCVFRGLEKGKARRVKIVKPTQAPGNDPYSVLQVNAVLADGEFLPVEPYARKIEVIGDSITSSEGVYGAQKESSWNGGIFGTYGSYPYLLGEALDADVHVISQSGYGVCGSWCGDPSETIPPYYEEVCGLLKGDWNRELGAHEPWDFASWQPDYIVINLGTNDSGMFDSAGRTFPDRQWTNPMRVNPDGSMNEEDRQKVLRTAVEFLKLLRKDNPGSYLLWCYGMLGGRMEATMREAVSTYVSETGDRRADFISLPEAKPEEKGARGHPGFPSHKIAAEILAQKLKSIE